MYSTVPLLLQRVDTNQIWLERRYRPATPVAILTANDVLPDIFGYSCQIFWL